MPPTAQFDFPGVQAVLDFSYTCSLGITPGIITVRSLPAITPAGTESVGPCAGTFRFSDGVQGLTVRDCRLAPNGFRQTQSGAGRFWEYRLQDRRWRWEDGYAIDGDYNQLDDHKKLIPWAVRSPFQLAVLCLEAMGEVGYAIDMPAGLAVAGGAFGPGDVLVSPRAGYLALGQNAPATNTNPRVTWDGVPAARALANLCAEYGRAVVYNPIGDQVSIQVLGTGSVPPPGAVLNLSPGVDPPRVPVAIVGRGSPTRFQMRLALRPVAREWDGSWQPLGEVSYAPTQGGQKMVVAVFGSDFTLNGVVIFAADLAGAAAAVNACADPRVAGKVTANVVYDTGLAYTASSVAQCLQLTGTADGDEFDLQFGQEAVCLAGPSVAGRGFATANPFSFATVVNTPQLSYRQAQELAQGSVWRCFQVVAVDPADLTKPGTPIPGGAKLFNRFLAILQDTKPEQVAPRPGDVDRIDPATGQPFFEDTYNGYSKDRAPSCYGRLSFDITGGNWANDAARVLNNTPRRSQFYRPGFTVVDPLRQVVQFAGPVYGILGGASARLTNAKLPDGVTRGDARFVSPELVIETGVTLLDPATLTPFRYTYSLALGNASAPARTISVPEAQADTIGVYDAAHNLTGVTTTDLYAQNCAAQQCLATAATYQTGKSLVGEYVGIVPIALSGMTRQVTYQMGPAGFTTTASTNSEHSTVVPTYPARRRAENVPLDPVRSAQNLASLSTPLNAVNKIVGGGG